MPLSKIQGIEGQVTPNLGRRNLIINGAMRFAQRATTASVDANGYKTVDRFLMNLHSDFNSKSTMTKNLDSLTPPEDFNDYVGLGIDTATTASGDVYFNFRQQIEAKNISHLKFGTSSAKTITVSFWVRSTLTGNFSLTLRNGGSDRSFVTTYNISAANTWEKKTITIAGDTTGTWTIDTGVGLTVNFGHGSSQGTYSTSTLNQWQSGSKTGATGSVQMVETVNSKWYITGLQIEVGDTATDFEHLSYGEELVACQRYLNVIGDDAHYTALGLGTMYTTTNGIFYITTATSMRTTPSLTTIAVSSGSNSGKWLNSYVGSTGTITNAVPQLGENSTNGLSNSFRIYVPSSNGSTTIGFSTWNMVITGARFILSAEL
jgi:hypothetical protein